MFGLGKNKKEGGDGSHIFDLEKDIMNADKSQKIVDHMIAKMQRIKELLRKGGEKEEFHKLGVLLHGYNSLRMVINRVKRELRKEE